MSDYLLAHIKTPAQAWRHAARAARKAAADTNVVYGKDRYAAGIVFGAEAIADVLETLAQMADDAEKEEM